MMKRTQRMIVMILAMAVAMSVLTACGGEPGGNTGTSGNASSSSQSQSNKKDPEDNHGQEDDKKQPTITAKTRTEKFFEKNATMQKKYHSSIEVRKNKVLTMTIEVASDGVRFRRMSWSTDSNLEDILVDDEQKLGYGINDDEKMLSCVPCTDGIVPNDVLEGVRPYNFLVEKDGFSVGTKEVDGVLYYDEYFTDLSGKTIHYCFEKSDVNGTNLRYVVLDEANGTETVIKVLCYNESTFDNELLRLPEGYQYYKYGDDGKIEDYGVTKKDTYPEKS